MFIHESQSENVRHLPRKYVSQISLTFVVHFTWFGKQYVRSVNYVEKGTFYEFERDYQFVNYNDFHHHVHATSLNEINKRQFINS